MNRLQLVAERNLYALGGNTYPGRGLVLGRDLSGDRIVQIYWIMGRSEASRNRNFRNDDQGRVFVEVADPAKLKPGTDLSLIVYNAMRERRDPNLFVVSNGDQTDTVWQNLTSGLIPDDLLRALAGRKYEPDEPNFTPRITGLSADPMTTAEAQIVVLKHAEDGACHRQLFVYPVIPAGLGYCVTTYKGDGSPLPSFEGEPYLVPLNASDATTLAEAYWGNLNPDNRVSLVVKTIELTTGRVNVRIINKYEKVAASTA